MGFFVGFQTVEVEDNGTSFPMAVMYPTEAAAEIITVGPYELEVAKNAIPTGEGLPLVIISHGSGGSHLVYRTLASHLAAHGFVVAMPEHPFDNRRDNSLDGTIENLVNRPRHLRAIINWFYDQSAFQKILKPDATSVIGHSMGGYTALAVAGGVPLSFPRESADGLEKAVDVIKDVRVKALVLMAPATVWYRTVGALDQVDVPILMLVGEKDKYTPSFHSQIVLKGLPESTEIIHRVVENAGHFSFLSPFPPTMSGPAFLPAQDPAGFDRVQFHETLNAEILTFLQSKF